jgi:hypothetical protein
MYGARNGGFLVWAIGLPVFNWRGDVCSDTKKINFGPHLEQRKWDGQRNVVIWYFARFLGSPFSDENK